MKDDAWASIPDSKIINDIEKQLDETWGITMTTQEIIDRFFEKFSEIAVSMGLDLDVKLAEINNEKPDELLEGFQVLSFSITSRNLQEEEDKYLWFSFVIGDRTNSIRGVKWNIDRKVESIVGQYFYYFKRDPIFEPPDTTHCIQMPTAKV